VVDGATAQAVAKQFVEVLMAPAFTEEALAVFRAKANVRVLEIPLPDGVDGAAPASAGLAASSAPPDPAGHGNDAGTPASPRSAWARGRNLHDIKRVGSGLLIQSTDLREVGPQDLKVVTRLAPTAAQLEDLLFAWRVGKYVKSNAIVYCGGGMTLGVGAGQMSRLDSARIASIKASHAGLSLQGSAVASDAFFPFRDGLDVVIDQGASCVIQPGGSMRDAEVIAAADERGVAMVFTGVRHFRH
jgi:phosphoribosylaminoimidazolecarboxamide formyltransferase/IMP cyclohydrolase